MGNIILSNRSVLSNLIILNFPSVLNFLIIPNFPIILNIITSLRSVTVGSIAKRCALRALSMRVQ